MSKKGYTVIESFCGPGGLGLGLHSAGFQLAYAFDYDGPSVETFKNNVSPNVRQVDAKELTGKELLKDAGFKNGQRLDLFTGGPPCQGFSKQKRGAHNGDDRNNLVLEYARLVHETNPRFFLLENVAMFGQKRGKEFIAKIQKLLIEYQLFSHFYNCADYGLAQTRQRFIIIGKHRSIEAPFRLPEPSTAEWATVRDVIGDMPEPPKDYSVHSKLPNHQRARVTEINIKRFSFVPPGGGWQDIPEDYRLECHKGVNPKSGGWPDVYGRLRWEGQCPTITGGFDSFTRGRYGHPDHDRPLTPREAARLQGFPDTHEFAGNRGDIRSQIGNAVPPPLAKAIGEQILRTLLIEDGLEEAGPSDVEVPETIQFSFLEC